MSPPSKRNNASKVADLAFNRLQLAIPRGYVATIFRTENLLSQKPLVYLFILDPVSDDELILLLQTSRWNLQRRPGK